MSSVEYSILAFIATILVGVIGYFLTDAHNQLKIKADKESLTNAVDSLRREQLAAEERYRREADKMEKQYDVKFAGMVRDVSDRMNTIENNLSKQIDLVIQLLKRENT